MLTAMSHPYTNDVIDFLASVPRFQVQDEVRLIIDDQPVGWLNAASAEQLATIADARASLHGSTLFLRAGEQHDDRSLILQTWMQQLHAAGTVQNWRDEAMTLQLAGQPFFSIERAAFRTLGLHTQSVHMNGWVATPEGMQLWVAERSHHKFVDPGKLDNLVGGGQAAGETPVQALAREAWEEAGLIFHRIPRPSGYLHIQRHIPEGIQDETIAVHDCFLPIYFTAVNQDGEVAHAGTMPLDDVLPLLLGHRFTWDASLVILFGLLRQRHFGLEGNQKILKQMQALGYL